MEPIRLAILDMYDDTPNQGMRCIKEIINRFDQEVEWELFEVRSKGEVPDLSFDIYIASGGPGSPYDGDGVWDARFYHWADDVWHWNQKEGQPKKHVFFICHSFQMVMKHYGLGQVIRRKSKSFGTFPCHMTDIGTREKLFDGLPNPFYIADFRDWQVVQPNLEKFEQMGSGIMALEKIRLHVPLERAIMAVRFSPEIFGTQFHPEADPDGMLKHFMDYQRQKQIIADHGEEKYLRMINDLHDSDKIGLTHRIILPLFLDRAIKSIKSKAVMA